MKKLVMALAAIPVFCGAAFGNTGWGTPTGTLAITTVEGAGVLQSASGYNYTITAYASFPNGGKFDPQGNDRYRPILGGHRFEREPHRPPIANDGMWWPANSGFDKAKGPAYGPYTAGYPGDCTSTPEIGGDGVEILNEVAVLNAKQSAAVDG